MEKVVCELVLIQECGQVLETMARPQPVCVEDLVRGGSDQMGLGPLCRPKPHADSPVWYLLPLCHL